MSKNYLITYLQHDLPVIDPAQTVQQAEGVLEMSLLEAAAADPTPVPRAVLQAHHPHRLVLEDAEGDEQMEAVLLDGVQCV